MATILIVEDDRNMRLLTAARLEDLYTVICACDGLEALEYIHNGGIDLIVADIMMPRMDGFELTRALREANYRMPVLIITAKDSLADKHEGFRAGTDDYMVKPVDVNEMLWRVEALLRRCQAVSQRKIRMGGTVFDCDTLTVSAEGSSVELPQKEFFLLYMLVASPNRIFTRRQIMDEVWGVDSCADTHTLEVHISRLRERFRENPDFEIVTVRGLGYKAVKKG